MEFGDILKSIRRERGLSQDEMAALLGTTKQVLSRYETKQRMPKLSIVSGYALKLGVPLSMLTGGDSEPEITHENGVRRVPILGGAIALDDELTLKRVRRIMGPGGRVAFTQLLPSNPAYEPIEVGGEEETRSVNILGKAVAVRFML